VPPRHAAYMHARRVPRSTITRRPSQRGLASTGARGNMSYLVQGYVILSLCRAIALDLDHAAQPGAPARQCPADVTVQRGGTPMLAPPP
jgi:hypothetical protein